VSFQKITKNTNLEMIIDQIKNEIKNGELKPGEKLPPERELAKLLGVSRTSIRESIQALAFSGYLNVIHGKGAFVNDSALKYDEISNLITNISDFSLSSLMEVRIMMEAEFARIAALRGNEDDIKKIKDCYEKMKNAESISSFVIEDLGFHMAIAEASHNELMNCLMRIFGELLHKETNRIVELSVGIKDSIVSVSYDIVQAINNKESEKAKELMVEHLSIVESSID